jgi:cell division protease FtsH
MNMRGKFPILYIIAALVFLFLFEYHILSPNVQQVPYSEFKNLVREGKFKSVLIGSDSIRGISKEPNQIQTQGKVYVTAKVEDSRLIEDLEKAGIQYEGQYENPWVRDVLSWVVPLLIFVAIWAYFFRRMGNAGAGILSFGKSKAKVLSENKTGITFNDVAGLSEAKEELKEIVEFLKNPEKFQRLGGRIPKGVLLVGPPGTGKTLLAKAVAGEASVVFFNISGSDFVEMFVGVGAARVRDLFAQAQEKAPCIVFIDELDALGKARGISPIGGGHEEREQTLNQLLVEMDGFDSRKGVIIMAATNRPEILDPALLRPGRFDRHVIVDKPDRKEREAILQIHAKNVKLAKDVDLEVIAARTPGFVGADLANIVNEAALLAARKDKESVEMKDFEEAIDRAIGGLEKKQRVLSKQEKKVVAYHEGGHALVAASVSHADPVHKISIVSRGIAALGWTLMLPTEDRYLMTKSELFDRMAVLLGGRVAEELVFQEVSTGASDDLQKCTNIARSMVTEYGMSENLGPLTFEDRRPSFLGIDRYGQNREYGDRVANEIDKEIRRIVDETYQRVREILRQKRDKLETLATTLLDKETLEGEELKALLA